ncbi:MAG TPA: flagellar export chaperone FliS [Bryobacteraceae bacterium]|nr:flagellar export chaperone FliS [Bryobacteraceae bacterium]
MWKEAYLANVVSTDPMELVCLLYQHALDTVRNARRHLAGADIAERGKAISKAVAILGELNSSLDHKAGGAISANLEGLYSYMTLRLTEANIRQQDAPMAEVESLLMTLSQAWQEAKAKQAAPAEVPVAPTAPVWQEANLEPVGHGWNA